ncbi:MAG: type II toxin-antitoxin system VapC family toxin [Bacteroidales bacterium]|nr:type II toxin-antitoxin system VapC family toxin [Bacteroidales bacterium]
MKIKAFLDTNVLLDVLQTSRPGSEYSPVIFQAIWDRKIEAVVTTQSLIDAAYMAEKAGVQQVFLDFANKCCDYINIDSINSFDIRFACKNYQGDFEDDAQYYRAQDTRCDVFVTSDKDFHKKYQGRDPFLQFLTPQEFVKRMEFRKLTR